MFSQSWHSYLGGLQESVVMSFIEISPLLLPSPCSRQERTTGTLDKYHVFSKKNVDSL